MDGTKLYINRTFINPGYVSFSRGVRGKVVVLPDSRPEVPGSSPTMSDEVLGMSLSSCRRKRAHPIWRHLEVTFAGASKSLFNHGMAVRKKAIG